RLLLGEQGPEPRHLRAAALQPLVDSGEGGRRRRGLRRHLPPLRLEPLLDRLPARREPGPRTRRPIRAELLAQHPGLDPQETEGGTDLPYAIHLVEQELVHDLLHRSLALQSFIPSDNVRKRYQWRRRKVNAWRVDGRALRWRLRRSPSTKGVAPKRNLARP